MKQLVNKENITRDIFYTQRTIGDPFVLHRELQEAHRKLKVQRLIINNRHKLLEEIKEELNFYKSLSKKLTTTLNLKNILRGLFSEFSNFMEVDIAAVLIRAGNVNHIKIVSNTLLTDNAVKAVKRSILKNFTDISGLNISSNSVVLECIEAEKSVDCISSSVLNDFPVYDQPLDSLYETLSIDGDQIGLINIYKYGLFSENQSRIFSSSIHQITMALKNSIEHMQVLKLATMDGLTGVINRRVFDDIIKREYQRGIRYNSPLSLLLLDVDFFKKINDKLGHQIGDKVLQSIAKRINNCIRNTDILARYGGEEFAMILPETDREKAFATAERIRKDIKKFDFNFNNNSLNVTVSIGVISIDANSPKTVKESLSPSKIIEMADSALYAAKKGGRNTTRAYPV